MAALAMAALAALLSLSGCGSTSTVHGQESFSLRGTRLVIDVGSSDLRLVPGSTSGVQVQRWLSGTAAEPGHSSWTLAGGTLQLSIDCTGLVFHCGSRFQVAVPPGVSVVVNSGDNADTVSGLTGSVIVNGGSGQVQVSGTSGPLVISTSSGSISASAIRSPTVRATSDEGDVDISFAAAPRLVHVATTDGSATATVPAARHRYHVVVTSGTGRGQSTVPDDLQSSNLVQVTSSSGNAAVHRAS
jgi:hypothetical protein